ncbi:MAG: hypothetical protein AB7P37_02985 [Ramlibacter sp.]
MKLLKRLLSGGPDQQAPKLEAPSQVDGQEESRMTDLGSQTHTRRELLRVLTRDTLRYCGIPEGWVDCQVLVVNTRKGETHMHARLVVRHWDEQLLRHAVAFERRLMAEIHRFEPQASEWLHSITWQFKTDNCPVTEMPPPESWTGAPVAVSLLDTGGGPGSDDDEPMSELEQDLAQLMAVRDSALAELRSDVPDFAATQPGVR